MKQGNRQQLDAEITALRDAFDAVWLARDTFGPKEDRAVRCAIKLEHAMTRHRSYNWQVFVGGRACGHNAIIHA